MKDPKEFCTCSDTACPNHPINHEKGCSPCILKNLTMNEIPSCFFHQIDEGAGQHGYSREDYAKLVIDYIQKRKVE